MMAANGQPQQPQQVAAQYSFSPASFSATHFDVDAFISAQRTVVTLERLLADLQTFQRNLKNELVELINNDYADFINLSTNLSGIDKALEHIRTPLGTVREDIQKSRESLQEIVLTLEDKLAERAAIREKKSVLQLLLNINECVEKVEELLGIRDTTGAGSRQTAAAAAAAAASSGGSGSGGSTERVASVFNQLQFYVSQARGLPLLNNLQPRIVRITDLLKQSLEASFLDGIRQNDSNRLTQSLRTYALTDKTREAEELYRLTVVVPFVQKTITQENLEALCAGGKSRTDGLAVLYQETFNFVRMDRASVLLITKSVLQGAGYDLYSNAIWPEVAGAIVKNLSSIFNAGIPDVFHKNYTHTMHFVSEFEGQLPSIAAVQAFRSNPQYVEFMQRWQQRQLPIYYQIRFREILGLVDEAFQKQTNGGTATPATSSPFRLNASSAVLAAIERCWHPDVFLLGLAHRFWKLTLQLLARYQSWVQSIVQAGQLQQQPQPSEVNGDEETVADAKTAVQQPRANLHVLVSIYEDLTSLSYKASKVFEDKIVPLMPPAFAASPVFKESFDVGIGALGALVGKSEHVIVQAIIAHGADVLTAVREIPGMYRMVNREAPNRALPYIQEATAPLRKFLSSEVQHIAPAVVTTWTGQVIEGLTQKYSALVNEVVQTVKRTEDSLSRLKKTKRKTAAATGETSDEDKMYLQLTVDIQAYGAEIEHFSAGARSTPLFVGLVTLVEQAKDKSSSAAPPSTTTAAAAAAAAASVTTAPNSATAVADKVPIQEGE